MHHYTYLNAIFKAFNFLGKEEMDNDRNTRKRSHSTSNISGVSVTKKGNQLNLGRIVTGDLPITDRYGNQNS